MNPFDSSHFPYDRPGALIAAVPAILGFVPESSFVLVTVERGQVGCVLRVDLDDFTPDTVQQMADAAAASHPERAVAVIVDADGMGCRMCRDEHRELIGLTIDALRGHDIELWAAHVVDRIAVGGRWQCADGCGSTGAVDDPSSSPLALAAVLDGRRLYANRAELLDSVTTTDDERAGRLAAVIERTAHGGVDRPDAAARRDVEHVMAVARAMAEGCEPTDDDAARIACALVDPRVRDTVYALAVGFASDHVEALWARLSRVLPTPWRAEALVLLAFSAYVRGDGPLAGMSLDAALDDDGDHRMANMLDQALQTAMRPEQIRELARTGYRLARRLGVDLPPQRDFGQRAS